MGPTAKGERLLTRYSDIVRARVSTIHTECQSQHQMEDLIHVTGHAHHSTEYEWRRRHRRTRTYSVRPHTPPPAEYGVDGLSPHAPCLLPQLERYLSYHITPLRYQAIVIELRYFPASPVSDLTTP